MTPYRSAQDERAARRIVLCSDCATPLRVFDEDELTCMKCGAVQPALRDDAALHKEPKLQRVDHGAYAELQEIAQSLGVKRKCTGLTIDCDGLSCSLSLDLNSGSAVGVTYVADTLGFPLLGFRREGDGDRLAKEQEIVRELQTGDQAFDEAVYIESNAADEDVLTVLRSVAVRAAIRSALEHVPEVFINPGRVYFTDNDSPACFTNERARTLLTALRVIAGAPRPREASAGAPIGGARLAVGLLWFALPLGAALIILGAAAYAPLEPANLIIAGIAVGLVAAIVVQPVLTRVVRGRSTSHRELTRLRYAALVGLPVLGIGAALTLNGALDRSPEWQEEGTIMSVKVDEDSHMHVVLRTPNRTTSVKVSGVLSEIAAGDKGTLWLRRGAFHQAWQTRNAVVLAKQRK